MTDAAHISVGEVHHPGELTEIEDLFRRVWATDTNRTPLTSEVLRALAHSGSYVAASRRRDGEIAGAAVGFLARDDTVAPAAWGLHSHIAAVAPGSEHQGIGRALKMHQRDFARRHGLAAIMWTFDPLVRRNAAFNCGLGVDLIAYYVDFYGPMADAVNIGQGSDRLLARWDMNGPVVERSAPDPSREEPSVLEADSAGRPSRRAPVGDRAWIAIPADISALRAANPDLAAQWRLAVRATLGEMLGDWRIDGCTPGCRYALRRKATASGPAGQSGG